jgi:phenol hydroxylase P5 protein
MGFLKTDTKKIEVKDGDKVIKAAEKLGVPFSCREGICGTCKVKVVEGYNNLDVKTSNEEFMDLKKNERLMCQCKLKSGDVKIKF